MSAKDVGQFLQALRQLDFAVQSDLEFAHINWGECISEDVRPFDIEEDVRSTTHRKPWWKRLFTRKPSFEVTTTMSRIRQLEPDFECKTDFDDLINRLNAKSQNVGRLFISGKFTDDQYEYFQAPHPSGEEINFRPDSWSLQFDEIRLGVINGWELKNGEVISDLQVGMMSFSLSGYGYFFPWDFKQWVEKFTQESGLNEVCDLCRKTWPVESLPPNEEIVMLRRECENLWPYDDIHAPIDWAWGPSET